LNAYVTGTTTSTEFPGAVNNTYKASEVFVVKLGSTGVASYTRLFGGSNSESASSIAVNTSGEAFVVGQTYSSDFPATIYDATLNGGTDGFLAKCGTSGEEAAAIALDASMMVEYSRVVPFALNLLANKS
jgi:hypothetical protein